MKAQSPYPIDPQQRLASRDRNRRGSVVILATFSLLMLFALLDYAVHSGQVVVGSGQLQNLTDAAALAGAGVVRDGGASSDVTAVATALANLNPSTSLGPLTGIGVEVGRFTFGNPGQFGAIPPGGCEVDQFALPSGAVRVTAQSSIQRLSLVRGMSPEVSSSAVAVAAYRNTDVVIVIDVSNVNSNPASFDHVPTYRPLSQWSQAVPAAVSGILGTLQDPKPDGKSDQSRPHQRIGFITYAADPWVELPLTPVTVGTDGLFGTDVADYVNFQLAPCEQLSLETAPGDNHTRSSALDPGDPPTHSDPGTVEKAGEYQRNCEGSNLAKAIERAAQLLQPAVTSCNRALMVLVTDRVPCNTVQWLDFPEFDSFPATDDVDAAGSAAKEAAAAARRDGIQIFVVNGLFAPEVPGMDPCLVSDEFCGMGCLADGSAFTDGLTCTQWTEGVNPSCDTANGGITKTGSANLGSFFAAVDDGFSVRLVR